ncbi:MAG: hypothetical protein MUE53_06955, partial [Chitinophagales bacterium]|nr:hypothetical protein [Chitinophagales bacterium]
AFLGFSKSILCVFLAFSLEIRLLLQNQLTLGLLDGFLLGKRKKMLFTLLNLCYIASNLFDYGNERNFGFL